MDQMQTSTLADIKTPSRGVILCEAIVGNYESDSGLTIIRTIKRNPKIDSARVIAVGGPFKIHGRSGMDKCTICARYTGGKCEKKERQGVYWAKPGDIIWMRRGFQKQHIAGKVYVFVPNEDVIAVEDGE